MTSKECVKIVDVILEQIAGGDVGGIWREMFDEMGPKFFGLWLHGFCMGCLGSGCEESRYDSAVIEAARNQVMMN